VAEANYRLAQVTAARWQKLLKSDAVSVQDADVKAGDAAARLAEVTAAQAQGSLTLYIASWMERWAS
jgi:hypothetical protein